MSSGKEINMKKNNNESWCKLSYAMMQDERLTLSAAVVYAVMLDRAKREEVHITAKKVAELTGQPQRNVERAIKQLKETGYITGVKQGQSGNTVYILKKILPDKKPKPEQEEPEQLEFDTPDSSGTFETDLTPEQVRHLSELLATKLSSDNRSPERIDKLLRAEYARMKIYAKKEVDNVAAYLAKTISNWEIESEPKKDDFDADMYDEFVNDFNYIRKEIDRKEFDAEKYEKICINNYEVI